MLAAGCSQVFGLDPPKLATVDAAHDAPRPDAPGCTTHAQCGSPGACLPDGTCGTDFNVAWVDQSGSDNSTCAHTMPCATITKALATGKPYIKVATGTITDQVTISQAVTILADSGAKLVPAMANAVVTVTGTPTVAIHDLRITSGQVGILVNALDNPQLTLEHVIIDMSSGLGLEISGGSLVVSRCVVSNNGGGGGNISAAFDIENSLFVVNGTPASTTGGLTLDASNAASVFAFNTIADNISSANSTRGVNCTIPLTGANNIVFNNTMAAQCTLDYSLFSPGTTVTAHNKTGSPAFISTNAADPTSISYYRIGATSAAIDSADPASTLPFDIDKISRPQGATFDIGASEYKP